MREGAGLAFRYVEPDEEGALDVPSHVGHPTVKRRMLMADKLQSSGRRFLAVAHYVVEHAVPDFLQHAGLLLNGFGDGGVARGHKVCYAGEVGAVGVAIVGVGHGKNDGEGRCSGNLGLHDDHFRLRGVGTGAWRVHVVRKDGHAHHEAAACGGVVWVEVGEICEVDGGGVVDLLEGTGSVEVADSGGGRVGLLSCGRSLGLLHCGAEGTRAGDLVGRKARDELVVG